MSFSGIDAFHESARRKIETGEPGWAQSDIKGVIVTFRRGGGFTAAHSINATREDPFMHSVLDEMLLDVARNEGLASPQTFDRDYVVRKIEGLRMYPSWNPKPHAQADVLETFYINGAGEDLLHD